ncbi:MAG: BamA/TamA family outer membrane protein, partial [Proteobacteria bacterium]|nr:BamA/TamA family outer membrane protein [Pseudomonadota bacterium]
VSGVGRNQISFGGGASALEGAFVQFGYATRNLFGRGLTLSVNGQFGGRTTSARLSFSQPYLFDRNIRFGFDLFRSKLDFIDLSNTKVTDAGIDALQTALPDCSIMRQLIR